MTFLELLLILNLKQVPPRRRTFFNSEHRFRAKGDKYVAIDLPWMTFGIAAPVGNNEIQHGWPVYPFAFVHERPWENLEDAANILWSAAGFGVLNGYGTVCVEYDPTQMLLRKEITPEESVIQTPIYCPDLNLRSPIEFAKRSMLQLAANCYNSLHNKSAHLWKRVE